jgi:hypothetical protein
LAVIWRWRWLVLAQLLPAAGFWLWRSIFGWSAAVFSRLRLNFWQERRLEELFLAAFQPFWREFGAGQGIW